MCSSCCFSFLLIPLLSLSLSVSLSCGIPEESWLFLFSLCLWWRDVVTMECSGACQRRHSGWTEWSNVGMRREEDYPEKGRGKIIWPCVHLQYFFIWLYSTHNIQFNKLQQQIYQTSCSPCQDNTWYEWQLHLQIHIHMANITPEKINQHICNWSKSIILPHPPTRIYREYTPSSSAKKYKNSYRI